MNGRVLISQPLQEEPAIQLAYFQNAFTISFSAMEYTNPAKNSYAYQLEGFDDQWIMVGADQRFATYTNLDPGKYTFTVKASNNNGIWNDPPRQIFLEISPPFWDTWLFKFIVALAILGLFLLYFSYLDEKQKEEHRQQLLEVKQEILQLKNEKLEEEVIRKNSELSAALLQSAHKNKHLEGMRVELSELSRKKESSNNEKKKMRQLVRKIDAEIDTADYWQQFQLSFDQVHQQFSHRIHEGYPQLSLNDIRLCCLIKIGLTNSEIAAIQNVSLGGVEKSKYRLKKKLNVPKENDLNNFILDFLK